MEAQAYVEAAPFVMPQKGSRSKSTGAGRGSRRRNTMQGGAVVSRWLQDMMNNQAAVCTVAREPSEEIHPRLRDSMVRALRLSSSMVR